MSRIAILILVLLASCDTRVPAKQALLVGIDKVHITVDPEYEARNWMPCPIPPVPAGYKLLHCYLSKTRIGLQQICSARYVDDDCQEGAGLSVSVISVSNSCMDGWRRLYRGCEEVFRRTILARIDYGDLPK